MSYVISFRGRTERHLGHTRAPMNRRNTLKTIGTVGVAGALGIGTSGVASADRSDDGRTGPTNPGRIGTYNGSKTLTPPDLGGFDHVILYLAEPYVEGDWSVVENAERFQREILGRTTEEIRADRQAAEAFYEERFGLTFDDDHAGLFEPATSDDGTAVLNPFYQDPDVGYNAYMVSGRAMPNNHDDGATNRDETLAGKVRDGGWIVSITEDTTLGGSYGDEYGDDDGFDVGAGGTLAYGDYNIKMGDAEDPIEIRYESEHPILPLDMPAAFNCDLFHDEWGEGQVRGTTNIPGGGIRNVLTFPPSL